ncbi:SagB family peptide dehydrogenase [Peribacillus simplex]|uniref:NADH oxidase n=2 Tax=Peribacillus simplex TaxID=1478 RepID=A0A223EJK9_9BACI|nr:SagB family peptide dehydrogenase [Peribacillus simplex]ASS95431.1 NADH oxidase [Peribacillus simplex NBRC 15720 = DSM 1321]MEC1397993.1 SagB family peptide dehydrogenase [Peribacillus simplex]MED3909529.1 SagB family peptide dehydrogenase [Peribacillus simplex]TVX76675.1 SagB/ThcOx family dehydrogenase [Peribacillus simplex]
MSLDAFLHNLHFDIEKASPPDWEVDWDDAPLTYKLYRDLPVFPLSLEVPLTLEECSGPSNQDLEGIGHFLWYAYGLTQVSQVPRSSESEDLMQSFRRFPASGGALYPSELYVYLKMEGLPAGVYHYDAAHHRLVLLREGDFDSYVTKALGDTFDMSACFGTVFVSTMFWKNFYKYNNFSYRLQGLDAGVLLGQLLEVAKRFGIAAGVCFQFLDRAINHLLGLSEEEESTYAVIPLSAEPSFKFREERSMDGPVTSTELCREMPDIQPEHYVRSQRIREFPMLTKMNEASMIESTQSFRRINPKNGTESEGQIVTLPIVKRLSYDLASVCRKRFSPEMDFILGKVSQWQLAALLQEATASFSYRNDLDGINENNEHRVSLYACLYNVEDIQDGAYHYDSTTHSLRQIQSGDHRLRLQYGMSLDIMNFQQVPICIHVVGERDHSKTQLGYRGYRIKQMEAGMLVQKLLLASSALGMNGHPLLGFDVNMCDELYKIDGPQRKTCLIQIPIGHYRDRPWLKGGLHS